MSEELDAKTFDLIGVLSGRDYPELEIPVYFNEALGFEIHRVTKAIGEAEVRGDSEALEKLDAERADLIKQSEKQKFIITLKSIPESVRRQIISKVQEEFPEKTDLLGRTQPNTEADEAFTKAMWQAYIRTVTNPEGAVKSVDEADVNALIANAPITAHEAITLGIQELQTGAKSGFEAAAKGVDFLSQP